LCWRRAPKFEVRHVSAAGEDAAGSIHEDKNGIAL
jgi:hypothetical protein